MDLLLKSLEIRGSDKKQIKGKEYSKEQLICIFKLKYNHYIKASK